MSVVLEGAPGQEEVLEAPRRRRHPLPSPGLVLSIAVVALVVLAAFWPDLFGSRDPLLGVPSERFQAPGPGHWFGTDELGRDLYARVVHGAALSLKATLIAVTVAFLVGGAIGLVAGFTGGWVEDVLMRIVDIQLSIPALFLSLALVTALGYGTVKVAVAVGTASVASFARVMRAEVLRVRQATYVEAAWSLGTRWYAILLRHVPTSTGAASSSTARTSARSREMRSIRGTRIGLVPQDPTVALNPVKRIGEQVAEVLRLHRLANRRSAALDAIELLDRAGLPDPAARAGQYPHELSGGMRQRALIAIAIAARPALLIADEPTSALDVTVQRRILDHLQDLTRQTGTAILLVTHDLGVAADRAQRIAVMSRGRIVETGPASAVLTAPAHAYTRHLVASVLARVPGPAPVPDDPLVVVEALRKDFRTVRAVDDVSFTAARLRARPQARGTVRRATPARRHRPRPGALPGTGGLRRTGVRAGRLRPGAGPATAHRTAGRHGRRVPVHLPRPAWSARSRTGSR